MSSKDSVDAAVASALRAFGRIDVLVNNAGYELRGDTENATVEATRKIVDTNFWGVVWLTQHAMRIMREDNTNKGAQGGVIMNVTSMGGRISVGGGAFYHATKWAVEGFTESVSKEVRPEWNSKWFFVVGWCEADQAVHFCLIEPGGVATDYLSRSSQPIAPHPAYAAPDTPARVLEKYLESLDATKGFATPGQIAAAMYRVVASGGAIPLRQPLGPDAWNWLKAAFDQAVVDHENVKEVALSAGSKEQADSVKFLMK